MVKKLRVHHDVLDVYGDGSQRKLYIYIDDLDEAVMTLFEKTDEDYNAYLVGFDSSLTVEQIVQIAMDEDGVDVPVHYGDIYKGWKGDARKYQYDVTALRLLGWVPNIRLRKP